MNNFHQTSLLPDYAVSPGMILEEELETLGISPMELQERTGLASTTINGILAGKTLITPTIALKLEQVLHLPAHLWVNLEQQYQTDLARLHGQRGDQLPEERDNFIDDWNDHNNETELFGFVEMSYQEYHRWLAEPKTLTQG